MTTTTLVLGSVTSGKAAYARSLLPSDVDVTYIAAAPQVADRSPLWARRVEALRRDRPTQWTTVETTELTRAILHVRNPVVVGGLQHWATALIDEADLWHDPGAALDLVRGRAQELAALWLMAPYDAVALSRIEDTGDPDVDEGAWLRAAGLAVVNAELSAVSRQVHHLVAGRVLDLSAAPLAPTPDRPF